MSSTIQKALTGSFSLGVATRIAQRQYSLSMQHVMSRLIKFAIGGVIGMITSVAMFVVARGGVAQFEQTRLLVTLVFVSGLAVALGSLLASLTLLWDGLLGQYARRLAAENELAEMVTCETEQRKETAHTTIGEHAEHDIAPITVQVRESFDELVVAIFEGEAARRQRSSSSGARSDAEEFHIPMADKLSRADIRISIAETVRVLSGIEDLRCVSRHDRRIVSKIRKLSEPGVVHDPATYRLLIRTLLRHVRQLMDPMSPRRHRPGRYKKRQYPHA